METIWMKHANGEIREFNAIPEELVRLMIDGWAQCEPPVNNEVKHVG